MDRNDSRPADMLAKERTFLAYVRTALAFVGFGFVIARFALFAREISTVAHVDVPNRHLSTGLGIAMAIAGILVGVYGAYRYVASDRAMRAGETRTMSQGVAIGGGLLIAVLGALVALDLFAFR